MDSLRLTDDASAAVAKTPNRVSLDSMTDKIAAEYHFTLDKAVGPGMPLMPGMEVMTLYVIIMRNGFTVIGKSAPACPANFDAALGRKLAREDAIRQLWPLEGYLLREKLATS